MKYEANITATARHYLSQNFKVENWEGLQPFFEELLQREIKDVVALEQWLKDQSEVEAAISEDACWRQIKMTCDTENKQLEEAFNYFCLEIQPKVQPFADALNKKLLASPFLKDLDKDKYYTFLRSIEKSVSLYREENINLQAEISVLQQQFGQISGAMMVTVEGKEYTLQQAAKFLENPNPIIRETVYRQIQERRLQDTEKLNDLFNQLKDLRNKEAKNAGFDTYTAYRFKELGRFDYTPEDCFQFHQAVKEQVLPLVKAIHQHKKEQLGLDVLRPWDLDAEPAGIEPLRPFKTGEELLQKSINCFKEMRPFFGQCLEKMRSLQHLDLDSRKGKSPGGYNCPLAESGAPFIFMNAAGQMQDVTTMVHEGGHAVHSFLAHPLTLNGFKEYPMEIAEVASMAMELFSMDYWHEFFDDERDLVRAKMHQLERVITIFPWIAIIDKFQHWLYANPAHTNEERTRMWEEILAEYDDGVIDYSGLETYRKNAWQRQLHLFEVPFYYIEYGIAQLGAIGMWKQFKTNKEAALDNYCTALSLGGTKTLTELYKAAGLNFSFAPETIKNLMEFVKEEMEQLK